MVCRSRRNSTRVPIRPNLKWNDRQDNVNLGVLNIEPESNEDRAKLDPRTEHYTEALRLYLGFVSANFPDAGRSHHEANPGLWVPFERFSVAEANQLPPVEGYLCLYCDLLGFSADIVESGNDDLPDFYGTALVSADENPSIKVYLLSDTCVAFAPACEAARFLNFVSVIFSRRLDDGLVPQGFVGYGSFVERKPDLGPPPANFLGTQIAGTALINAADFQKTKPLGSRILVTQSAFDNLPIDQTAHIVLDGRGNLEFLPERGSQFDLLDCLYYLQYLRILDPGTRVFDHYIWSYASRALRSGRGISEIALDLVEPHMGCNRIQMIVDFVGAVLDEYRGVRP